jgi:hypothetical protein
MIPRSLAALIVPFFAVLCASAAERREVDPEQTRLALVPLFAASNETIPGTSSCQGEYGQHGKAKLGDLLSMQLAYFYRGSNVVSGQCAGDGQRRCSVTMSRSFGEDVSSTRVDFVVSGGKLNIASLACVMTP